MEFNDVPVRFAALSHPTRVALLRRLVSAGPGGLPAGEIAVALGVAPSSLSFHLRELERAGLVRASRAGRTIHYAAELDAVRGLAAFLTETCCDGGPVRCGAAFVPEPPRTVLFLCTGNSHRSIMAEAILNREGAGRFRAVSAGSHPEGAVAPETLDLLRRLNHPVDGLRSKSWDEFAHPSAPSLHFVITVCDSAAGEICPSWPGQPMAAHWGVPDPAWARSPAERGRALSDTYRMLANRIGIFVTLPMRSLDRLSLQRSLDEIGQLPREPRVAALGA
ncbi:metalloregulator ArsR/SmtB family transcription factor [Elioraea sp.]|uniref:metalloregulator ArsR/SmtB family transcription factor n=1 Tax=Elioraea sp. TaxID=2185103 RepID=UPI003F70F9A0